MHIYILCLIMCYYDSQPVAILVHGSSWFQDPLSRRGWSGLYSVSSNVELLTARFFFSGQSRYLPLIRLTPRCCGAVAGAYPLLRGSVTPHRGGGHFGYKFDAKSAGGRR